jgi:sporulation protein YtfJ
MSSCEKHPIEGLMSAVMQNLKEMVNVNTVVGDCIEVEGTAIVPVSKVSFGFASGGSDFCSSKARADQPNPFGGGSSAGVIITPIGFMTVSEGHIRFVPVNSSSSIYDKLVDMMPEAIDKLAAGIKKIKVKKCKCDPCDCDDDFCDCESTHESRTSDFDDIMNDPDGND